MNTKEVKYFLSQSRTHEALEEEIRLLELEIIGLAKNKMRKVKSVSEFLNFETELALKLTEMKTKTMEYLKY